ncbi:MAG: histidine kinase [Chloroflexi bacterium]|nr:histidine kinase [Chloroflexota bacterium]
MSKMRVAELEKEIEDLRRRLPAHSLPPTMLQRLEDLEDELDEARREMQVGD